MTDQTPQRLEDLYGVEILKPTLALDGLDDLDGLNVKEPIVLELFLVLVIGAAIAVVIS